MTVFETPTPITANIDVSAGNIRITASERADTSVDVCPSDESRPSDVKAAAETRVEYDKGNLLIKSPKQLGWPGKGWSIEVAILLPTDSRVGAETGLGDIVAKGRLADCALKSGLGDIVLDQSSGLELSTGLGDVSVGHAAGHANISTGSGKVRINKIDGQAVIKNSNGASWVGDATGAVRMSAANGDIDIGLAHANVEAKTANGSIRLGEVMRGDVFLETSLGDLAVGIREGAAAHLDVSTRTGRVHNLLNPADNPGQSAETVRIRARTNVGDVVIRRS